MAKRAQRQRNESDLSFELRKVGYLERGIADLPGQANDDFPALLSLVRARPGDASGSPIPLADAAEMVRVGVNEVSDLSEPAARVLRILYAIEDGALKCSPQARYDMAADSLGASFERSTRPGSRSHAFGLLAAGLEAGSSSPLVPLKTKFVTLDDSSVPSAREVLVNASELSVRTRSGAALLIGYKTFIREMLAKGGELRLLTLVAGSAAAEQAYGSSPDLFGPNSAVATACVHQLLDEVPDAKIHWRETREPTWVSQIIAKRGHLPATSVVQVNLMFAAQGRDRPVVVLDENDDWFVAFLEEFEYIWSNRSVDRIP